LYQAWTAGGSQGYGFSLDSGMTLNLTSPHSWIGGFLPFINQISSIAYEFVFQTIPADTSLDLIDFDIVQSLGLPEGDSVLVGERITLNTSCLVPVSVFITASANPVC
jgi:hypothetical protein